MKMTPLTSSNQDALKNALARLNWTQSDLARRSRINASIISGIINRAKQPSEREANAIQRALGEAGEYLDVLELWSETFAPPKCGEWKQPSPEMNFETLWDHAEARELAAPEYEYEGLEEAVERVLSNLSERTYEVLKRRFWEGESRKRVGNVLGVTNNRVLQIESDALRTLKHPTWVRKLGVYMPRHLKPGAFVIRHD
jgi:transcriptional regulator with XRE-family HTH domain